MFPFDYFKTRPLPASFQFKLDDGTQLFARHLRPDDASRLHAGFGQLSQLARRRKFAEPVDKLSDDVVRRLTEADGTHVVAWGAADLARPDEPGLGVARFIRLEHEPDAADVAIVILDEYMNKGAGVMLHACLHISAHHNGLRHLYYDVASENERFIRHLKGLGAEFVGKATGVTRLKCPVYARAWDVPHTQPNGRRFAQTLRRLMAVEFSDLDMEQMDEHIVVP